MAEFETVSIKNPTSEYFSFTFNGERYKPIPVGESRTYPIGLAYFVAKHLSNKILDKETRKIDEREVKKGNIFVPQIGLLMSYDNTQRRIALYDILGSKELVEYCVQYMNLKSFIGEMKEYDEYVAKKESAPKTSPPPKKDGKKDQA